MKLRINGNSIRFRLSPADVERLVSDGCVSESTSFGADSEFRYSIRMRNDMNAMRAILGKGSIAIEIPAAPARDWSQSEVVGMHHLQKLDGGKTLDILIEKDFECLDGSGDEPGTILYPNPGKACTTEKTLSRG